MAEVETILSGLTLVVVLVVLVFVSIAYYRTRIRRLLVLFLLAALLGINMLVTLAEETLEEGVPAFDLLSSLFAFGIAFLLLLTVLYRVPRRPE